MKAEPTTCRMMLMPPEEGKCRICAVEHEPEMPHDATSLFYGLRFKMRYGREGTWADATAHCTPEMRAEWKALIPEHGGRWTEPPEGVEPISEPIDG